MELEKKLDQFDEALRFATRAHAGVARKFRDTPFILHPVEVACIAAGMTEDIDVLIAALLHDTIEDAEVTILEIQARFGERVAELVMAETENKYRGQPAEETWEKRKKESLEELEQSNDIGVKILWLSDKLANLRSFYPMYRKEGDAMWNNFHQSDKKKQEWYYGEILRLTKDLEDTVAYQEYQFLFDKIFKGENHE